MDYYIRGNWDLTKTFLSEVQFDHNWLPVIPIRQINTDNGRFYEVDDGRQYKSVTTVLGERSAAYIDQWKKNIGEEEATKIGRRAASRGTKLHENAESYLRNNAVIIPKTEWLEMSLMNSIKPLLSRISNIRLLEASLFSHTLKLAGTVDCVADFDGVPSIIDFKTTTKSKSKEDIENYFIQTSIYSLMVEERYGLKIRNLAILIAQEYSHPQLFLEHRRNWFKQIKEICDAC